MENMTIYHGSDVIVERPQYGKGKPFNDYGQGFYCTENVEVAKEWACRTENDGVLNIYVLDKADLRIVHLKEPEYNILNWMALLVQNRRFNVNTPVMDAGRQWLLDHFLPDLDAFDVVTGYRADDSYFSFARAFLSNGITLQQLEQAMHLGNLGEQIVLKSRKAFDQLHFSGAQRVDARIYHSLREMRDHQARDQYKRMLEGRAFDGIFLSDLIRGGEYYVDHT